MEYWERQMKMRNAMKTGNWDGMPCHIMRLELAKPAGMPKQQKQGWTLAHDLALNGRLHELPAEVLTQELLGCATKEGQTVAGVAWTPLSEVLGKIQLLEVVNKVATESPSRANELCDWLRKQGMDLQNDVVDDVVEVG